MRIFGGRQRQQRLELAGCEGCRLCRKGLKHVEHAQSACQARCEFWNGDLEMELNREPHLILMLRARLAVDATNETLSEEKVLAQMLWHSKGRAVRWWYLVALAAWRCNKATFTCVTNCFEASLSAAQVGRHQCSALCHPINDSRSLSACSNWHYSHTFSKLNSREF